MKKLIVLITAIIFISSACKKPEQSLCCILDISVQGTLDSNFMYSNVITPNADGDNDYLFLEMHGSGTFEVHIYDDSDNLLFADLDYSNQFNGITNNGLTIADGIYRVVCTMPNSTAEFSLLIIRNKVSSMSCVSDCQPYDPGDYMLNP